MTCSNDSTFNYNIDSRSFLKRAKQNLKIFDNCQNPQFLFYAALEIRTGIECRLYEYIKSSLKQHHIKQSKIKEYTASKLLKKLANIDIDTQSNIKVLFSIEGSRAASLVEYTPVTKELASFHGKLGELLHYKFFKTNPIWYYKMKLSEKYNEKSLSNYREFLQTILLEFEECTRGVLLSPPNFYETIEQLNRE